MAIQLLDKVLVMKPRRSNLVKSTPVEKAVDNTIDNIYGEKKEITLGAVEVPIEKQISIDKASTKGLKSQEYKNTTESKVEKLRKLRRGN